MSSEDKEMLQIMIKNTNAQIEEIKNPNSELNINRKKIEEERIARLAKRTLQEIINEPSTNDHELYDVALKIGNSKEIINNAESLLIQIMRSKNSTEFAYYGVSYAVPRTISPITNQFSIMKEIIDNPKIDNIRLQRIVWEFCYSGKQAYIDPKILNLIIDSPKANGDVLGQMTEMIYLSKSPLIEKGILYKKIIYSSAANREALMKTAKVLAHSTERIKDADVIYSFIIHSKLLVRNDLNLINDYILKSVALEENKKQLLVNQISNR
jgi:hypothetical protein